MSKQRRAHEYSMKARKEIKKRDKDKCIFCAMGYRMSYECAIGDLQIMHYINRSQGGLGIPENGALGCIYHHQLMDNGGYGLEMKELFREYLKSKYPGWKEEDLYYDKWRFLKV